MKKVAFHNLGCKVNSYEMEGILHLFQKRDYEIVDFAQKSDIYIINTCTVTNIADRKSRQMIHRARALNPKAVVVAAGCYVQTHPEEAVKDECVDIVVGNNHKSEIVDIVEEYLNRRACCKEFIDEPNYENSVKTLEGKTVSDLTKPVLYENLRIYSISEHTRAFIKIQDGCNQFCSYCAIPFARGRVRSRDAGEIIDEVKALANSGCREVVLTGIHLSSYGLNESYNSFAAKQETNEALLEVIERVSEIKEIERVRLGSLEPRLITEEFVKRLYKIEKICPHFHISLQSGSDTVLGRMNRHYTVDEYERSVILLRKYFEHPAITTDVIAGFPGETQEEAAQTRNFLEKINLYECHVFKYSRRAGTIADKMKEQLTDKVKQERSSRLIADSLLRKNDYVKYYVGRSVTVLIEESILIEGKKYYRGFTPEYVECYCTGDFDESICGRLVKCRGLSVRDGILYADAD